MAAVAATTSTTSRWRPAVRQAHGHANVCPGDQTYALTYCLLTLLCLGLQARGARQASQARLSREGACETAAEGEHVQERLQGRFLRMQGPLVVDLSLRRQP